MSTKNGSKNTMIGLVRFLEASGVGINSEEKSLKIHLACYAGVGQTPIDAFYEGSWKSWQEGQSRPNFMCEQVLSLIDIGNQKWLFVGVYKILSSRKKSWGVQYSTKLLANQDDLIGRIIVQHERTRNSYIWNKPEIKLPIVEIRPQKMTMQDFPGYNAIVLPHSNLQIVTEQQIASWHGPLACVKGIYLITDTKSGKHYVGQASGRDGIWGRWCDYAKTGHGGNKELKALLRRKGAGYATNFQYSVLEIADTHASDEDIHARESYWMLAIQSREFGLN